jgi:hypothetical protein
MNTASIYSLARDILNTNSTVLSDAKLLEWLNIALGHRTLDILRYQVDRNASMTMAKTDFVSTTGLSEGDNGYNGEYSFPSDLLRPIRAEISFDGTTWNRCKIYDLNENEDSEASQEQLNSTFSVSDPVVNFERYSYFVRPLNTGDTVANGIRVWYEKRQTALTAGDSPEFEQNLHDILAYDIAGMELIRHAEKYPQETVRRIEEQKSIVEDLFIWFYNNQMKRTFRLNPKVENCS